jgi:undecaprenyl-diphosphatase
MHEIDIGIYHFFHDCAERWPGINSLMDMLTENELLKAGPVLFALWAFWFVRDAQTDRRRAHIVSLLIAGCGAALFSVFLTRVLPLRPRPMFDSSLTFAVPQVTPDWFRVSSLPSDHAAMFVAMASGLMYVSRRWGWLALLHAVLFICLPRAYVGLHYFGDLVAGAMIGAVFAWLCNTEFFRTRVSERVVRLEASSAPVFYAGMLILSLQIADLFHGARAFFGFLAHASGWVARGLSVALV